MTVNKEEKIVNVIKDVAYTPIRLMFLEPNREQSKKIQKNLKELYRNVGGKYYIREEAFEIFKKETGVN